MCGIYKITNIVNNKIYIGQSLNIETRWKKHLTIKDNTAIHLAIQKYGKESFTFAVVEECSATELFDREKYWIQYYNCIAPLGYNLNAGGEGGNPRAVQCYNENGEFIKEFMSITQASQETGIALEKIVSCCREPNRFFAGEYQWKYSDDNRTISPKKKRKSQIIYQFDLNGILIQEYPSITEAAQVIQGDKSSICACCNGRQKTAYGYQWSYETTIAPLDMKNQRRQVNQYTVDGTLIATYSTLTEAARAVGGTPGGVGAVCTGRSKTCKGYIFKYCK